MRPAAARRFRAPLCTCQAAGRIAVSTSQASEPSNKDDQETYEQRHRHHQDHDHEVILMVMLIAFFNNYSVGMSAPWEEPLEDAGCVLATCRAAETNRLSSSEGS